MPRTKVDVEDPAAEKTSNIEIAQESKAPKDINGQISKENILDADASNTRRSGRKRAGDFSDTKDDMTDAVKKDKAGTKPAPPKKEKKSRTNRATEGKVKPSKIDGHPIEIEKKQPGGDMVETDNISKSKATGKLSDKSSENKPSKQERKKDRDQKADQKASKDDMSSKKSATSKKSKAKSSAKSEQSGNQDNKPLPVAPEQAMDQTPFKALVAREKAKIPAVKASADAAKEAREKMAAANTDLSANVDGKASKSKTDKSAAKPKVKQTKTSAEAPIDSELGDKPFRAEAERPGQKKKEKQPKSFANPSVDSGKEGQLSKGKKSKATPKATAEADETAPGDILPVESEVTPQKGQKRKASLAGEAPVPDSASGKKQKKSRPSIFEAATDVVGSLVTSGVEAAKELASSLGNKSIADDVTGVAADVIDAKQKASKRTKKNENQSNDKEKPTEDALANAGADADDAEESEVSEEDDQTAALIKGFESDSDDAAMGDDEGYQDGQEVPKVPKSKDVDKKMKAIRDASDGPGVIYVGRIPHGFYEPQMRAYFSQFGTITRLRLSRNKSTGASKHYAFIEFTSLPVAKIIAETMDNYLLFGHLLKVKYVLPDQIHPNLWKGANKRFKKIPRAKIEGRKLAMPVGEAQWGKRVENERKRREGKKEQTKKIGYEFDAKLKDVPARQVLEENILEEEERTIVTTGEGEGGTVVISEEVTKKVVPKGKEKAVKKGEKRKSVGDMGGEGAGAGAEEVAVVHKVKKARKNAK